MERFVKKAQALYNNFYDYSEIVFVDYDTPIKIKCNNHGLFEITPKMHLGRRTGLCPKCILKKIHLERSLLGLDPIDEQEFLKNRFQISRMVD
jgi:hypothetical protein